MMTLHVLHAGNGYTYLTDQVASNDVAQNMDLVDYYQQTGNPPGRWVGRGSVVLGVEGPVSAQQMAALYGEGLHPDADAIVASEIASGASPEQALRAAALGRRFPNFQTVAKPFREQLDHAIAAFRERNGRVPATDREREAVRMEAAQAVLGPDATERDRAQLAAEEGRKQREAVAGYDLVFTPVKSVSTLWGLAGRDVAEQVAGAHETAWRDAIAFVEERAALTRVGAGGVAQVDTNGLTAAAFDHYDSRSGDPNLHTHVAVSNKVQGKDGVWRSIDGRTLHSIAVAASERYGIRMEEELVRRLGLSFEEVPRTDGKRPTREVKGIDPSVAATFSQRRAAIETAYAARLAQYRAEHGSDPSPAVQYKLAQEVTLATREAKGDVRSQEQMRSEWRRQAARTLGSADAVDSMLDSALSQPTPSAHVEPDVGALVDETMEALESRRSTWMRYQVAAEAQRVVRSRVPAGDGVSLSDLADEVTEGVLLRSLDTQVPATNPTPDALSRASGESIYAVHGRQRFTSLAILEDEDHLVDSARLRAGLSVSGEDFQNAVTRLEHASKMRLDAGQIALARSFAMGGRETIAGIGPAGAGKTSAMRLFIASVEEAGGNVVGLAPSAVAARVLSDELGVPGETVARFLVAPPKITDRTLILVDEAGMTSTRDLVQVLAAARNAGASIRLLGDASQLGAVQGGGALRLIQQRVGAVELTTVHRFRTPGEAEASLLVRDGDKEGAEWYLRQGRVQGGGRAEMIEAVTGAWWKDTRSRARRRDAVMIASTTEDVRALNASARTLRKAVGLVRGPEVALRGEEVAARGDIITTRRNDRELRVGPTDFVRNGERWKVLRANADGSLRVRGVHHRAAVTLPVEYVRDHVELGYASTVHRVQGMTVDRAHVLLDESLTREQAYTALTRGRQTNLAYIVTEGTTDVDADEQPSADYAARTVLHTILGRSGEELAAASIIQREFEEHDSLARRVPAYEDAATRVLDPHVEDRMSDVVFSVLDPERAQLVVEDPAWPSLMSRMAAHEAGGADLGDVFAAAVHGRELGTAESVAQVLHSRLGAPEQVVDGELPSWIIARPSARPTSLPQGVDPAVVQWLEREAEAISARLDLLVLDTATNAPEWAGPAPAPGTPHRSRWDAEVRAVVAYRDRYEVTGDSNPLGDPPAHGLRAIAYAAAIHAAQRLNMMKQHPTPEETPVSEQPEVSVEQTARERIAAYVAGKATKNAVTPSRTSQGQRPDQLSGRERLERARADLRRSKEQRTRGDDQPRRRQSGPQR